MTERHASAAPLSGARWDIPKGSPQVIPEVIPIICAPDAPGMDDEPVSDEFAEQAGPPPRQAGGWRGFLSRWGGGFSLSPGGVFLAKSGFARYQVRAFSAPRRTQRLIRRNSSVGRARHS